MKIEFVIKLNNHRIKQRNYKYKEMFFALELIESYGSGIRRAKNAMKANGSPDLVFEPDNDTDDYIMVTAYINDEFKKIQWEERGLGSKDVNRVSGITGIIPQLVRNISLS